MNKYAVIKLGGKQLKVSEGDVFEIERQKKLNIDVLMYSDGKSVKVGTPVLKDISVTANILEDKLDKRVIVARYKSKSRYRKRKGHRQPISVVKISKINEGVKRAGVKAKTETEKVLAKSVKQTASNAKRKPVKVAVSKPKKASTKANKTSVSKVEKGAK